MEWKSFSHKPRGGSEKWLAGADPSSCPYDVVPVFVEDTGFLPDECLNCYKPLILRSLAVF